MFIIAFGLSGRIDEDITSYKEDNGRCTWNSAVSPSFFSPL
jgi:hypothetical protein